VVALGIGAAEHGEPVPDGLALDALGDDVEPRLRPSSIVERTIVASSSSRSMPMTNERSILISSTGRRRRCESDE
jgi:hypothetical protein